MKKNIIKINKLISFILSFVITFQLLTFAEQETEVYYYGVFEKDSIVESSGLNIARNNNTIMLDKSRDDVFLHIEHKDENKDYFFQYEFKDEVPKRYVLSFDIASPNKNNGVAGIIQGRSFEEKNVSLNVAFEQSGITFGNGQMIKYSKNGDYINVALVFNTDAEVCKVYRNGKQIGIGYSCPKTKTVRFYFNGGEVGQSINIKNLLIYSGNKIIPIEDLSKIKDNTVNTPQTTNEKVNSTEYTLDIKGAGVATIDELKNSISFLIGEPYSVVNGQTKKIDPDDDWVVPFIKNDTTFVPFRFISESLGMSVSYNNDTIEAVLGERNVSFKIGDKEITTGSEKIQLDEPIEIINDRTFIPLRTASELFGKYVHWDKRGIVIVCDKQFSAGEKEVSYLVSKIKNSDVDNYALYPYFTDDLILKATNQENIKYNASYGSSGNPGSIQALYYLTMVLRSDENAMSENGIAVKETVLRLLRSMISGGAEPFACVGPYWGHSFVSSSLLLVKNTSCVYDELTEDEKYRMDLLMRCLVIAANWGYNDENNYYTGTDLKGNFGKSWNPNFTWTYMSVIINAAMYFGSDEVDEILTSFDYDLYMSELESVGFKNIISNWSVAGKELMENGGACYYKGTSGVATSFSVGEFAGTGKGVKLIFKYDGLGVADYKKIFKKLLDQTYNKTVVTNGNGYGTVTGEKSPFEGQIGMLAEFDSRDGGGVRSSAGYCLGSFMMCNLVYANMKLFGGWNSKDKEQKQYDSLIYVGNEDLIFKLSKGYLGVSNGHTATEGEYEGTEHHLFYRYELNKEIWRNFHCMRSEDTTIVEDPNYVPEEPMPVAQPLNGDVEPSAKMYITKDIDQLGTFSKDSYHNFEKGFSNDLNVEYDVICSPVFNASEYDGCIMLDKQYAENLVWGSTNIILQFQYGHINIRDGAEYKYTGIRFSGNYRFHVRYEINVNKKKYNAYITPIYPEKSDEIKVAENASFRTGANPINNIGCIITVNTTPDYGSLWVDNLMVK